MLKYYLLFVVSFSVLAEPKFVPNAYGLGVGKDRFGRAVRHPPAQKLRKDAYGMGVSADQTGKPVRTNLWGVPTK